MPKYVFRTQGDSTPVEVTVHLPSLAVAAKDAVVYLGELLQVEDGRFWENQYVRLTVEDEEGDIQFTLDVTGQMAPAIGSMRPN